MKKRMRRMGMMMTRAGRATKVRLSRSWVGRGALQAGVAPPCHDSARSFGQCSP